MVEVTTTHVTYRSIPSEREISILAHWPAFWNVTDRDRCVVVQAPASVYAFLSLEVLRLPEIMGLPEGNVQNLPDVVSPHEPVASHGPTPSAISLMPSSTYRALAVRGTICPAIPRPRRRFSHNPGHQRHSAASSAAMTGCPTCAQGSKAQPPSSTTLQTPHLPEVGDGSL